MSTDVRALQYDLTVPITSVGNNDLIAVAVVSEIYGPDSVNTTLAVAIEPTIGGSAISFTEEVGNIQTATSYGPNSEDGIRSRCGIVTIDGSSLSGTSLNFRIRVTNAVSSQQLARAAMRAFRVTGSSSITVNETEITTNTNSSSSMSHQIEPQSGDVSISAGFFADGEGHTFSGHSTTYAGVSDNLGSGDFASSTNLTSATTIQYQRGNDGNSQGDTLVSAVFRP